MQSFSDKLHDTNLQFGISCIHHLLSEDKNSLKFVVFLMRRRPPRSTQGVSSAASDVYKRQEQKFLRRLTLYCLFQDLFLEQLLYICLGSLSDTSQLKQLYLQFYCVSREYLLLFTEFICSFKFFKENQIPCSGWSNG